MKNYKTLFASAVLVALTVLPALDAPAQVNNYFGQPYVVVDSASTNGGLGHWTNVLVGSTTPYTNVVRVNTYGKDLGVEFSGQCTAANAGSNVIFGLGRNISGTGPTNQFGIGLGSSTVLLSTIEQFATLNVTMSGTNFVTVCTNFTGSRAAGVPSMSGITYFYVLWASNTVGQTLSNYTIRVYPVP